MSNNVQFTNTRILSCQIFFDISYLTVHRRCQSHQLVLGFGCCATVGAPIRREPRRVFSALNNSLVFCCRLPFELSSPHPFCQVAIPSYCTSVFCNIAQPVSRATFTSVVRPAIYKSGEISQAVDFHFTVSHIIIIKTNSRVVQTRGSIRGVVDSPIVHWHHWRAQGTGPGSQSSGDIPRKLGPNLRDRANSG
jgi:hypothetical protein